MVLARESVFRSSYFPGFFFFLLLFSPLYRIVFLEQLACFLFFIFEIRLIPALFLILSCGYQTERVQAGTYLLFYTLLASLPLLVGILFITL